MTVRRFLRLTHGVMGVVLAAFLVLVAGSGTALAFMGDIFAWQYGKVIEAASPRPRAPYADVDAILSAAALERGPGLKAGGVLMPHTRVPNMSVAMVFGTETDPEEAMIVAVDPWTARAKGHFWLADAFGHDLLDFHHELLAGEIGATFVAILGLLLVLFAGTGLYLWWPRNGRVWRKARSPALRGPLSAKLYHLHGWLGVWTAVLVLIFALSGSALSRPSWFGSLLDDAQARAPSGRAWERTCPGTVTPDDAVRLARQRFAARDVSTVNLLPGGPIQVLLRGSQDLNRIEGDSLVWVHPTCPGIAQALDIGESAGPVQARNMLLSLHGGYLLGPILGKVLVVVTGLSLMFFVLSGTVVFFVHTWRGRRVKLSSSSILQAPGSKGLDESRV